MKKATNLPPSRRGFQLSGEERILMALYRSTHPNTQQVIRMLLWDGYIKPLPHEKAAKERRFETASREMKLAPLLASQFEPFLNAAQMAGKLAQKGGA